MDIPVSREEARVPITIFQLAGRINLGNARELEEKARQEYDNGMQNLLIDLKGVESLTSAGLRAILYAYKLLGGTGEGSQKSPHLKLLNPSSDLLKVLQTAGFDSFIEIHSNRSQALASF